MTDDEFDRWLKLFRDHGEHNIPLCDAAAVVHDSLRLAIASARTLSRPQGLEKERPAEYMKLSDEDRLFALAIYDRFVEEMERRKGRRK